ncbi:P-type conjugative transfer protein TrbL [Gilliamella sp. B2894]|uniref:P-type conjugative transfer protein TrbL n=1 Tax=Gilliamella sp. B2894 TaxID=2817978 RepID=UPI00226AB8C9|nr:P-type conjugative transfer protein TrbL [Gilliamella sp. B2894]MCX8657364.1 P-type conjugative transfer protein TrbL [Gilliamella sp. B2894]
MKKVVTYFFFSLFIFVSNTATAAIDNKDVLDKVLAKYKAIAVTWEGVIMANALWLFWTLVTISMIWTFGLLLLKRADIGEFFSEFFKFIMFTGFYLWLLRNAPEIGSSIINGLGKLAANAAGISDTPTVSSIVDIGFNILGKVLKQSSIWSPVDSLVGMIVGFIILIMMALIAINMLLLLISSWVLLYAGIFFLGFGGSRWTSDMAINYYKTLLGVAVQIFTMILLVGIGKSIIDQYYADMSKGIIFSELSVVLIVALTLLMLVNRLPQLISGIITGASVGGMGIGSFGAGAAIGAAATAAAAFGVASQMASGAASNIGGGAKAIMEAFKSASIDSDSADIGSSGDSGDSDGSSEVEGAFSVGESESPLSSAMGGGGSSEEANYNSSESESGTSDSGNATNSSSNEEQTQSSSNEEQTQEGSIVSTPKSKASVFGDTMKILASSGAGAIKDAVKEKVNSRIDNSALGKLAENIKNKREGN